MECSECPPAQSRATGNLGARGGAGTVRRWGGADVPTPASCRSRSHCQMVKISLRRHGVAILIHMDVYLKFEDFGRCSGSCLERDSLFDDLISGDDQRQSTCVARCVKKVEGAVSALEKGCWCNLCANLSFTSLFLDGGMEPS